MLCNVLFKKSHVLRFRIFYPSLRVQRDLQIVKKLCYYGNISGIGERAVVLIV